MKYSTTILILLYPFLTTYSQTDEENLEKYWKFRNNFRKNFVKVGGDPGESVPLNAYHPNWLVPILEEEGLTAKAEA